MARPARGRSFARSPKEGARGRNLAAGRQVRVRSGAARRANARARLDGDRGFPRCGPPRRLPRRRRAAPGRLPGPQRLRGRHHRAHLHPGRPRPGVRGHRLRRTADGGAGRVPAAQLPALGQPRHLHLPGRGRPVAALRRRLLPGSPPAPADWDQRHRRHRSLHRRERRHRDDPGQPSLGRRRARALPRESHGRRLGRPAGSRPARDAGRRYRGLPRHARPWRRRQPQRPPAPRLHQPVLPALGAHPGELLPRHPQGPRAPNGAGGAEPARLLDHPALPRHGDGVAPA